MNFKHKDFVLIANNEALCDIDQKFSLDLKDKNIIHFNKAIHFNNFLNKGLDNYLCLNSLSLEKFHGYELNLNRSLLFNSIFFLIRSVQIDEDFFNRFGKYIESFPNQKKEIVINPKNCSDFLHGMPTAGFQMTYHLFNKYPNSKIYLIGFCGKHKLSNNKIALDGHNSDNEQLWYKKQSNIIHILNQKPCSPDFHYPCNICKSLSFNDRNNKC